MTSTPTMSIPHLVPYLFAVLLLWLAWKFARPRSQNTRLVAILVLGDIGRSPRMMYHAQSFAENNFETHVIGYAGSKPIPALELLPQAHIHHLPEPPALLKRLPFAVSAPVKILHQIFAIIAVLVLRLSNSPEFILVQNPPSVPTLALAQIVATLWGSKLIIDWHNLGYSILALKLGNEHRFVKIAKWFEATFGHYAYAHLFVTKAMHDSLVKEWNLQCVHSFSLSGVNVNFALEAKDMCYMIGRLAIFIDPPIKKFMNTFAHRVKIVTPSLTPTSHSAPSYPEIRLPVPRPDRPALLVSSTSWTPDEDFDILLDALGIYEIRAAERSTVGTSNVDVGAGPLPKLFVIVTGKGPLKDQYMEKLARLQKKWSWVRCTSLWLEAEDYPTLLGSADLGVCLHASSSALDLPMKIVDMFGCGLPVCALDFTWYAVYFGTFNLDAFIQLVSIGELVKEGVNGLVFKDASQLAQQLEELLLSFPDSPRLQDLRSSLTPRAHIKCADKLPFNGPGHSEQWEWCSWDENWDSVMKPLVASTSD
ncbi:hypothetical protein AX17_000192 [Amanita inopinata Kibby_2008]|nr:hypothetical protein AX17_000192 [Amanita inopinata Kibby_2008]